MGGGGVRARRGDGSSNRHALLGPGPLLCTRDAGTLQKRYNPRPNLDLPPTDQSTIHRPWCSRCRPLQHVAVGGTSRTSGLYWKGRETCIYAVLTSWGHYTFDSLLLVFTEAERAQSMLGEDIERPATVQNRTKASPVYLSAQSDVQALIAYIPHQNAQWAFFASICLSFSPTMSRRRDCRYGPPTSLVRSRLTTRHRNSLPADDESCPSSTHGLRSATRCFMISSLLRTRRHSAWL